MRVFACMASTLDGKIGPANADRFISISSPEDHRHLKALRDQADGILFGASTFRAWPRVHLGLNGSKRAQHFIMSRSLDLDQETPLFQDKDTEITVFTSLTSRDKEGFPVGFRIIDIPEGPEQTGAILDHIKQIGVTSLLIEGGGNILNQFVQNRALQELYLTLTPSFMGQTGAPDLLGGRELSVKPQLQLLSSRRSDNEMFLHYKLEYSK